jgi:1-acyl-sn-glycerol-3-phosphate acyltransferase
MPLQGPVILAINHPAVADTPFVGTCLSGCRSPYFMAEEELFLDRFPFRLIASLITPLGAFPVDRRLPIDPKAIGYAADRLAEGNLLVVAPEGGTEQGWGLLPFRPGFVLLALLARERLIRRGEPGEVKIVPAALCYRETPRGLRTKRAMRFRAQAGLSVGEPISLESFLVPGKNERRIMEEVTTVTRDRVGELLAQLQQEMGGFNSI